jgi:hypothetical protein
MANPKVGKTKSTARKAMDDYLQGQVNALRFAAYEIGIMLEEYAKTHHNWTPITFMTDNTTGSTIEETSDTIYIWLSSGSDHAKYLELARQGKWAWLRPAILNNKDRIMEILRSHLGNDHSLNPIVFKSEGDF